MNLIGLAQRIKTLRRERGLTLEQVATRAGMTRSGLSKVENFRATPSLPALVAIAEALSVTVAQLVEGLEEKPRLVVVRKGQGSRVERDRPRSKLVYHSLAGERHTKAMEPLLVVVPGNRAGVAAREALAHEGEEFLYVISGSVDLEYMGKIERLHAGDSAYFDAHMPHRVINPEPRAAKVLCIFGGFRFRSETNKPFRRNTVSQDNVAEMYRKAQAAFETVRFWPQEKVDEMVQAVGWEWQKEPVREELARLAVDESGIGVFEDKKAKIRSKTLGTLWDQRGAKTCGLVEEDHSRGIRKYAKPIGVIANVVPCTNPESTICCLGLSTLKTRNAMIVSPHPRTQGSSFRTVEYGRKALAKIGAPVDLLQCIEKTSHEKTSELMAHCDFAVATGGAALVKVVYAAGKPAHTVGAGNVVSIVDETADLPATARKIMLSKLANNSASCSSENAVAIYHDVFDAMLDCLKAEGGYLCSPEEREVLRAYYWPDGKALNRELVAKPARFIAERAGLTVPETTRFLMVEGIKPGPEDRFSGEKISPTLTL